MFLNHFVNNNIIMKHLLVFLCFGFAFLLTSCGDDLEVPDFPCIQEKIDAFKIDDSVCATTSGTIGGNVVTFNFKGETVYCFNWGTCNPEKTIDIYTKDCVLLCEMGGFAQVDFCDGTPWLGNATEIDNLYQN